MAPIISIWHKLFSFGKSDGARKKEPEGILSDPKKIILTIFIKSHQMMLHAKYECFSPYGLSQEDLKRFLS